jgi:Animal haem peroxidase
LIGDHLEIIVSLLRLGLSPDEAVSILRTLRSPLPSTSSPIAADDPTVRRPDPGTCPWPTYRCDVLSKYRSFDGSCNNLVDPIRGRSFTPFSRYLPQAYADGMRDVTFRFAAAAVSVDAAA